MVDIEFAKLSGSGNDFLCIDARENGYGEVLDDPARVGHFARSLCRRGLGVGADGIVFACTPEIEGVAEVAARYLEPDGSETDLCGNGTACFIRWARSVGIGDGGEMKILSQAGVVRGQVLEDGYVRVCIPLPEDERPGVELDVAGRTVRCDYIVTGIEHVVLYVDDLAAVDMATLGPAIRYHKAFVQPRGVNVNFIQELADGEIAIRTYEYGVEGETLACGTGSAASAVLAARHYDWSAAYRSNDLPILVRAPGGDVLRVYFGEQDGRVVDLCLDTVVRCTFKGTVCPDLAERALAPPAADDDLPEVAVRAS